MVAQHGIKRLHSMLLLIHCGLHLRGVHGITRFTLRENRWLKHGYLYSVNDFRSLISQGLNLCVHCTYKLPVNLTLLLPDMLLTELLTRNSQSRSTLSLIALNLLSMLPSLQLVNSTKCVKRKTCAMIIPLQEYTRCGYFNLFSKHITIV